MSVEIQETKYSLEIETAIGLIDVVNDIGANSVAITVENLDSSADIGLEDIPYETIVDSTNIIELSSSSIDQISINTDLIATIPPDYIIGLNNYLSNFIDSYEIDCGSP